MLTDSFIVPTSLGDIDHPCPREYLHYTDDLIQQYGTFDFRFSWDSYDESSRWSSSSVFWNARDDIKDFRLTQGDWDLMVRMLFEGLVRIVREECDDDDPCTRFVRSNLTYRMKSVSKIRTILRWFDQLHWCHLPLVEDSDPVLYQIEATPRFIKELIGEVSLTMRHNSELDNYLLPAKEMRLEDIFNLLRMQYPSEDPQYLPPSRILIEHEMKAKRLLEQWEYRTQELIAD